MVPIIFWGGPLAERAGEKINLLALLDAFPSGPYEVEGSAENYLRSLIEASPEISEMMDEEHRPLIIEVIEHNVALHRKPESFSYSGNVLLFVATQDHEEQAMAGLWRPHIHGEITTVPIACGHQQMLQRQPIARIGRVLGDELRKHASPS
jgi:hypothetical protein